MLTVKGTSWSGASDGTNDVFADIADKTIKVYAADATIAEKNARIIITKASICALTLARPTAGTPETGGDDGKKLKITSASAYQHTITCTGGFMPAATTITLAGNAGDSVDLTAYNGYWYIGNTTTVTGSFSGLSQSAGVGLVVATVATGISFTGTYTTEIVIGGTATTGISITTTATDGINISGVLTNGIKITGTAGVGMYINKTANAAGTLKIHCHQMAASTDDSPNQYANEFKGEFLATSGTMDGIASHFHMSASGTGILRSVIGDAYLDSGITLSGTDYSTGSWLVGGLFDTLVSGTLNGTGVCVAGLYGGVTCSTGTMTAAKYVTSIWGNSQRTTALSSGISSLLLLTNPTGCAALTSGIYLTNGSANKITSAMYVSAGVTNLFDFTDAGNSDFLTTGGTDCTASGATDPSYTAKIVTPGGPGYVRIWAAA